ncbi:hypothetical protein L1987_62831 [Smallanthus sonchifolius]|uniref:Uncharacterized protein n=1 Tax=Smallanthus sonchifolius TaxID=185202 RepID=A0ACB9CBG9_9ASTR|nr:hypothetical protein L1987_62831 [Smallanthus sonchifolius]
MGLGLTGDDIHFIERGCSDFVSLFHCLPSVEHLQMNRCQVKFFTVESIPHKLKFTDAIVHLNFLGLFGLSSVKQNEFNAVLLLVASSPNIKKLKLEMGSYEPWELKFFEPFFEPEMDFVKLILAKSPMLEKVGLVFGKMIDFQNRFWILKELLELPRASSLAKIIVGE